jgi:hypothetical protein
MRAQRERRADRPALDLCGRGRGHRLHVPAHRLPVEGRQQQLALRHVAMLVEREQRVLAQSVGQRRGVRLAGVEDGRVAGETCLTSAGSATYTMRP